MLPVKHSLVYLPFFSASLFLSPNCTYWYAMFSVCFFHDNIRVLFEYMYIFVCLYPEGNLTVKRGLICCMYSELVSHTSFCKPVCVWCYLSASWKYVHTTAKGIFMVSTETHDFCPEDVGKQTFCDLQTFTANQCTSLCECQISVSKVLRCHKWRDY